MKGLVRIVLKYWLIVEWSSVLTNCIGHFDLLDDDYEDFQDFDEEYHRQQSVNVRDLSYKHKENNHSCQSP